MDEFCELDNLGADNLGLENLGAEDFGAAVGEGCSDLGAEALEGYVEGKVGERLAVVRPTDLGGEDLEEVPFYGGIEVGVFGDGERGEAVDDELVDGGTEGFDEVIGEGEGVETVVVPDAEADVKAAEDDAPGDGGTEDGVAVVEAGVDAEEFWISDEVVAE